MSTPLPPQPRAAATTLYVPATARRFMEAILEGRPAFLPSVTLCLEDSIAAADVPRGLATIQEFLGRARSLAKRPAIFIRPRNPGLCAEIFRLEHIELVTGFVLPKFDLASMADWEEALGGRAFWRLPTLETAQALDAAAMRELAAALKKSAQPVLLLRVGGNDLMRALGVGRDRAHTIYDGPLGYVLGMLRAVFVDFPLAAPVFEFLDEPALFREELARDILYGFCGKTAIHPNQLEIIREMYSVPAADYERARAILQNPRPVFRFGDAMCEPATQAPWARNILERAQVYGLR